MQQELQAHQRSPETQTQGSIMNEALSPVQDFAVELLVKDALSKMAFSILVQKKSELESRKGYPVLFGEIDQKELDLVNKELNFRLKTENVDLKALAGLPLFFDSPTFSFRLYNHILSGGFLVGLAIPNEGEPRKILPVMFSEHGLFGSIEEVDVRSPIRLVRRINEWRRQFPVLHRTLVPVLADFKDCAKNIDVFRDKLEYLLQQDRYYVSGTPLVDIRPKAE
jgi:hypothetical protein